MTAPRFNCYNAAHLVQPGDVIMRLVAQSAKRGAIGFALMLVVGVQSGVAHADQYVLDPEHTEVRFTWDHLGMSRQGGRFVDVTGTLDFDEARPDASKVSAIIKVASIWTGVAALDSHLVKSREFFDAAKFPTITFTSTAVRPTGAKTAEVVGDLTINGQARPAVLAVTWNFAGGHPMAKINPALSDQYVAGFSAVTQIRRSDWGMTRTVPFVSDEIQITIETELKRTAVTPPAAMPPAGSPTAVTPTASAPAGTSALPPAVASPGGLPPAVAPPVSGTGEPPIIFAPLPAPGAN